MADADRLKPGALSPQVQKAFKDLAWAESMPSARQVRGLAALATPVLAVLAGLLLLLAALFGFKDKKFISWVTGILGVGALGTTVASGAVAAKPDFVLDPRAARILADRRAEQVRALRQANDDLEAATPAIVQAVLDSAGLDDAPALEQAQLWRKQRERMVELTRALDRSLAAVGPLGSLGDQDASDHVDQATEILERMSRARANRALRAQADAEVAALDGIDVPATARTGPGSPSSDEEDSVSLAARATPRTRQTD